MSEPRYRRPADEPCKASFREGPTVQMRGLKEPGHRCPECHDTDWVVVTRAEGTPTAMPCRVCNPVQYRRWLDKCLRGDGVCGCEVCIAARAGRIGLVDYAPDGTLLTGAL